MKVPAHLPSAAITLTESERAVWRYYVSLGDRFCRSLNHVATDLRLNEKTVRRANAKFRDLGLLTWVQGFGNRAAKARGCANRYWIRPHLLTIRGSDTPSPLTCQLVN